MIPQSEGGGSLSICALSLLYVTGSHGPFTRPREKVYDGIWDTIVSCSLNGLSQVLADSKVSARL